MRGYVKNYNREGEYPIIGRQGALCGNLNYASGQFYATEHAVVVECFANTNSRWAFYFLDKMNLHQYATATAQPGISVKTINEVPIFLPPLAEQHRIVTAIKSAFSVIDEIERNKSDLQIAVTAAKSKILSLAIRGKLVPQDLNDESASVLLERVRADREKLVKAGKIKRTKGESAIVRGDDNSYYGKLPQGWALARLGEVCEIARGGSPRPIQAFLTDSTDGINWIKIGDTKVGGKYITKTEEKIKPEGIKRSRYVNVGDFLLSNSMSFGRPYILKIDGCVHDGWLVLGKVEKVFNADFLYYALSSPLMYDLLSRLAAGSTVKNLNSDLVKMVVFPIPPLNEQIHIVTKIENTMKYFDKISADLI